VSGQLHARPLYPRGKSQRYPLDRRGEEKILPLPGLERRPLGRNTSNNNNGLTLYSAVVPIRTSCSIILELCILSTECICVFRMVLTINRDLFCPKPTSRLVFVAETMPVTYELNFYNSFCRYSVFSRRMGGNCLGTFKTGGKIVLTLPLNVISLTTSVHFFFSISPFLFFLGGGGL
jgi:hypothetical protein